MLFCGFLSGAGLRQVTSTVWPAPLSFVKVDLAIIPHLIEGIQGLHMSPKTALVISTFLKQKTVYHVKSIAPLIRLTKSEKLIITESTCEIMGHIKKDAKLFHGRS